MDSTRSFASFQHRRLRPTEDYKNASVGRASLAMSFIPALESPPCVKDGIFLLEAHCTFLTVTLTVDYTCLGDVPRPLECDFDSATQGARSQCSLVPWIDDGASVGPSQQFCFCPGLVGARGSQRRPSCRLSQLQRACAEPNSSIGSTLFWHE